MPPSRACREGDNLVLDHGNARCLATCLVAPVKRGRRRRGNRHILGGVFRRAARLGFADVHGERVHELTGRHVRVCIDTCFPGRALGVDLVDLLEVAAEDAVPALLLYGRGIHLAVLHLESIEALGAVAVHILVARYRNPVHKGN